MNFIPFVNIIILINIIKPFNSLAAIDFNP